MQMEGDVSESVEELWIELGSGEPTLGLAAEAIRRAISLEQGPTYFTLALRRTAVGILDPNAARPIAQAIAGAFQHYVEQFCKDPPELGSMAGILFRDLSFGSNVEGALGAAHSLATQLRTPAIASPEYEVAALTAFALYGLITQVASVELNLREQSDRPSPATDPLPGPVVEVAPHLRYVTVLSADRLRVVLESVEDVRSALADLAQRGDVAPHDRTTATRLSGALDVVYTDGEIPLRSLRGTMADAAEVLQRYNPDPEVESIVAGFIDPAVENDADALVEPLTESLTFRQEGRQRLHEGALSTIETIPSKILTGVLIAGAIAAAHGLAALADRSSWISAVARFFLAVVEKLAA
jgi:hypothetical protein